MKTEKNTEGAGYETTDVDAVSIALAGLLVAFGVALVVLFCAGIFHFFIATGLPANEARRPMMEAPKPPPGPRLQVAPSEDLRVFRQREDAEINSYGWVDRQAGIVRIPISRAMELILKKGLPVLGQPGAKPAQKTNLQLSQERPLEYTAPKSEEAK